MPQYKAPLRDMRFLLNEVFDYPAHYQRLPGAAEATPDTVITLVDGKKYVVGQTTQEVVDRIRHFRASILRRVDDPHASEAAELYVFPQGREGQ